MTGKPPEEFGDLTSTVRRWLSASRSSEASGEAPRRQVPMPRDAQARARAREADTVTTEVDAAPAVVDAGPAEDGVQPLPRREDAMSALPQRILGEPRDGTFRVALLVDAGSGDEKVLPVVVDAVRSAYGAPALSRAYGDWAGVLRPRVQLLRHCGVQPVHTFSTGSAEALVAMTVDALDAVRDYGITCVVIVADVVPALPLVARLRAGGTHVVAIMRPDGHAGLHQQVDELVDLDALMQTRLVPVSGRHRAGH